MSASERGLSRSIDIALKGAERMGRIAGYAEALADVSKETDDLDLMKRMRVLMDAKMLELSEPQS